MTSPPAILPRWSGSLVFRHALKKGANNRSECSGNTGLAPTGGCRPTLCGRRAPAQKRLTASLQTSLLAGSPSGDSQIEQSPDHAEGGYRDKVEISPSQPTAFILADKKDEA